MNPWTKFVQNISAKLAFFPPSPTYEVLQHSDGTGQYYIQPKYSELPRVLNCTVKKLKTKKRKGGGGGDDIVAAFIPYTPRNATKRVDTTILYSHGNAVDLGQLMPFYKDLARALRANIMAYDYTGYGASTGQATVQNTLADVEAVFQCLQQDFGVQPANIIAYGQSVGSGPTAWLAATHKGLAGVVMHTPLLSGIRVLNPGLKWWPSWADVYPNHLLVSKIDCPLLVLHGTEDEVIHFSHGKRMHELARNKVEPLWAVGYNHQNLELCPQYLPRLRRFLADLFPSAAPASSAAATAAAAATALAAGLTASPPPQNVAIQDPAPPPRPATASGNIRATWSVPVTAPEKRDEATRRPAAAAVAPLVPRPAGPASPAAAAIPEDASAAAAAAGGGSSPLVPQESAPNPTTAAAAGTPAASPQRGGTPSAASPAPGLQPRLNLFSNPSPSAASSAATRSPSHPPHSGLLSVPWGGSTSASPSAAAAPPLPATPLSARSRYATPTSSPAPTSASPTASPGAGRPPAARKLLTQEPPEPLTTPSTLVTADILPTPTSPPASTSGAAANAAAAPVTAVGAGTPATAAATQPTDPSTTTTPPDAAPPSAAGLSGPPSAKPSPPTSPPTTAPASPDSATSTATSPPAKPAPPLAAAPPAQPASAAAPLTTSPLAPTPLAPPSLAPPLEKAFLEPGSAITADTPPRPLTAG